MVVESAKSRPTPIGRYPSRRGVGVRLEHDLTIRNFVFREETAEKTVKADSSTGHGNEGCRLLEVRSDRRQNQLVAERNERVRN